MTLSFCLLISLFFFSLSLFLSPSLSLANSFAPGLQMIKIIPNMMILFCIVYITFSFIYLVLVGKSEHDRKKFYIRNFQCDIKKKIRYFFFNFWRIYPHNKKKDKQCKPCTASNFLKDAWLMHEAAWFMHDERWKEACSSKWAIHAVHQVTVTAFKNFKKRHKKNKKERTTHIVDSETAPPPPGPGLPL